jgi:hypothetical protein
MGLYQAYHNGQRARELRTWGAGELMVCPLPLGSKASDDVEHGYNDGFSSMSRTKNVASGCDM